MKKRIIAVILMAFVAISSVPDGMHIQAAEVNNTAENIDEGTVEQPTGLLQLQMEESSELDETQIYKTQEQGNEESQSPIYRSMIYDSDWDKYSSNYFYNQLGPEQQTSWRQLEEMCNSYLAGIDNIDSRTKYIATPFTNVDDTYQFARVFRFSHPQYYFLNTTVGYSRGETGGFYVAYGVYTQFRDGQKRKTATDQVKKQADAWEKQTAGYQTEEEKVKYIHDVIVEKVDYNDAIYDSDFNEDEQYSQSAYSVLCGDLTVCAGYAQTFAMICNGAGIDCMSVTSSDHQWNKVRINDSWYNVDCTWADQKDGIYYDYFERNDAAYTGNSSHSIERFWKTYLLPSCTLDSGASGFMNSGTLPEITQKTQSPVIQSVQEGGQYKITVTCETPDALIYVSQDGNDPSVAFSRSRLYTGPCYVKDLSNFAAIAVHDTYWDSDVTTTSYDTIHYDGNGATDGNMVSDYIVQNPLTLKENTYTRKGCSFIGWNTKADGSGKAYTDKQTIDTTSVHGDLTLYAQWKALPAVSVLKASSVGFGKVQLKWEAVENIDGYLIYAKKHGQYGYCGMTTKGTSFVDTNAEAAEYNFYWVYPYTVDASGKRTVGTCVKYVYAKGTPRAVSNLKAENVARNEIKLTWTDDEKVDGYMIYRKNAQNGKFEPFGVTEQNYYIDEIADDTAYNFYRVYPYVKSDEAGYILGTTEKYVYAKGVLPAVTGVKAKGTKSGVQVTWNSETGAAGYIIYKKNSDTGKFEYLTMSTKMTGIVDKKASSQTYNFYRVYPYYTNDAGKRILGISDTYVYAKKK